jgi:ribosomal-protein-alanine N-acetyltransferase
VSGPPRIETARLRLRGYQETDAPALHAAFGDPVAMRHWDSGPTHDAAETARRLKYALKHSPYDRAIWTITRRADGEVLGLINYHHREARNRRVELGWLLIPGHGRQGYMTEATRAVIAYCIAELQVHRFEALIEPENAASQALARRLGFRREAELLRDRNLVDGQFRSAVLYGLLAPEFIAR